MTERIRLAPTPYIMESLINADHWDWPKAYAEFIDNSFGQSAGRAESVTIDIKRNATVISDDGRGIRDLKECFILGASTSKFSKSDIGRYGVGAKHASVWMGKNYYVQSVRNGVKKSFAINWDKVRQGDSWPQFNAYREIDQSAPPGTVTSIKGFWPSRKKIVLSFLERHLSEWFAPALEDGRSITIIDHRPRGGSVTRELVPWRPSGWSDKLKFEGSVDGRPYTAEVGILSNSYSSDCGLRICFAHRVVTRVTRLDGNALPVRFFGYVRLGDEWKDRLATNKTEIVDSQDLEQELLSRPEMQKLMALAEEYQQAFILEGIVPRVEALVNTALKLADTGEHRVERTSAKSTGISDPGSEPKSRPPADENSRDTSPADPDRASGLRISVQNLGGHMIGKVQDSDDSLTVVINGDCPHCKAALDEATTRPGGNYPTLFSVIGSILSIHARLSGRDWLEQRLKVTVDNDTISELEMFLNWWFFKVAAKVEIDDLRSDDS